MTKIRLILTFDYELPLGGCTSYSKGLFEPAEAIVRLATERKIKIVFFADILSAVFLKRWDYKGFYLPFKEQLQKTLNLKHEVQLHIHPHWVNSRYEGGRFYPSEWKILSKFRNEKPPFDINGILNSGINELNEICNGHGDFKCIAYRGGGYNLQPCTDIILKNLYENGIRFDSSIIKGYYFKSNIQEEDFRRMPDNSNWIIPLEGPLNAIAENGILEIPIASMPAGIYFRLNRVYNKTRNKNLYKKLKYNNFGTGHTGHKTDMASRIKSLIYSPLVLSFDHLHQNISVLDAILSYQFKIYGDQEEIALCLNSHPKSLGPYHLNQMCKFLDLIDEKYKGSVEICGYHDLDQNYFHGS